MHILYGKYYKGSRDTYCMLNDKMGQSHWTDIWYRHDWRIPCVDFMMECNITARWQLVGGVNWPNMCVPWCPRVLLLSSQACLTGAPGYMYGEREREREREREERERERDPLRNSSVCRFCHHCLIPDGHSCGTENPWGALRGEQGVK